MSYDARSSVYLRDLHSAIGSLLPHRGLGLFSDDPRVRWTDRLLVIVALLMSFVSADTLVDRFHIDIEESLFYPLCRESRPNFPSAS